MNYYIELLGTKEQNLTSVDMSVLMARVRVTDEEDRSLCELVSEDEVKKGIFSIPSYKSSGPDGFT